jgi:regulator of sirC expression with transglutaminase-like and TPR domain
VAVPWAPGTVAGVDVTATFAEVVAGPDVPLDRAAMLISAHAQPGLDPAWAMRTLDGVSLGVSEPTLDGVREHLFDRCRFRGDRETYHDPRNSMLDQVIARRRGLPITLSVLMIEVGRRVGAPLAPVGMPGHFLVRDRVDPDVFVDPFAGGILLDAAGCEAIFRRIHPGVPFDPAFLEPVPPIQVVARMLENLAGSYRRTGDRAGLTWVLDLRRRLPGADPATRRELALLLAAGGQYTEAAGHLEALDTPEDAVTAAKLRARLN